MRERQAAAAEPQVGERPRNTRIIPVRQLLGQDRCLRLEHAGEIYLLRITRNDKLILTK